MKIMSLLRKPQSRGQEQETAEPEPAGQLTGLAATEHRESHVSPYVPPEYRPENRGQGEGGNQFGRARLNPPGSVAAMMDGARAAGVQPKAQPGPARGAQHRGGVRTPQRPPAADRRQNDRQQQAGAPTPDGVARLFKDGLSYRDISGRLGIPESAVQILNEEHRESKRTLAEKIRSVGQAPRLFPWAEVRAALTTANNNGGGLVGSMANGQLGFLHDMASMMVLEYLGMDDVRVGEDKSYWGEVLPQTGWTVEGGVLTNTAAPTLGTLSVKPLSLFSRYDVTSTLAHTSEMGFMMWLRDSVEDLLSNQLVAALFDGDPADNKIEGILRKTNLPTIYFGAALTEASIRNCVSLLRTNLGVGERPVWLLSEGYRNAAVAGKWASETGVHTGVMLPDDAGGGIHYVVSQHLAAAGVTDPAILLFATSWRVPIWGLMASQHQQPDNLIDQYALELLCNSVPLQPKSFVRTQGGAMP